MVPGGMPLRTRTKGAEKIGMDKIRKRSCPDFRSPIVRFSHSVRKGKVRKTFRERGGG